jgi:F-type H+-transporting ATPase subunit gamma
LTYFGKKGRDWGKKDGYHVDKVSRCGRDPRSISALPHFGRKLVDGFLTANYDEVYIVFAEFISMAKQLPTIQAAAADSRHRKRRKRPRMPIALSGGAHLRTQPTSCWGLLPRNVYVQLFSALLETSTSEHAARMMAMDNATKACNDMIEKLTLAYNKARQAAITADLMDIVGGAEALKG